MTVKQLEYTSRARSVYFTRIDNPINVMGQWLLSESTTVLSNNRWGEVNPAWRRQVKLHQSATTNMTGQRMRRVTLSNAGLLVTGLPGKEPSFRCVINGDLAGQRSFGDPGDNNDSSTGTEQQARMNFLKEAIKVERKMQGLVFIGELREAIHMLRHPAESLQRAIKRDYLDKLKRLKRQYPNRWRRMISDTWLEASFGWSPFINDLKDAHKAYQEVANRWKEPSYVPIFGVAYGSRLFSQPLVNSPFAPVSDYQCIETETLTNKISARYYGVARGKAIMTTSDWARPFGLTAGEFFPTAWELLPWSFLLDYFSNIGDIIEVSASHSASIAWVALTTKIIRERLRTIEHSVARQRQITGANLKASYGGPWTALTTKTQIGRDAHPSLETPSLTFELPGRRNQLLNMAALLSSTTSELHSQDVRRYRVINGVPHFRR